MVALAVAMSKKIDFKKTFKYCEGETAIVASILGIVFLVGIVTAVFCGSLYLLIVSVITTLFVIFPFAVDLTMDHPRFWVIKDEDSQ